MTEAIIKKMKECKEKPNNPQATHGTKDKRLAVK
jgi:hypothetical protein